MRHDLVPGYKQPPDFCEAICRRYGANRYGELIWRVRWAGDRIKLNGGYWDATGRFEYMRVRRYGEHKVWLLERYVPAKFLGHPQTWAGATSNSEGYLNQGPYPAEGIYICTDIFKEALTPTLVMRAIQATALGDLTTQSMRAEVRRQEIEEKDRESDERFDREWELIDNPRRGTTFAGAQRLNDHDNLVIKKAIEIAAETGGKFRDAKSGFEQLASLEDLK